MLPYEKEIPKEKARLHPRNKHRDLYDFALLIEKCPDLAEFVVLNKFEKESIDSSDPKAVKMLNKALLQTYYDVVDWDIPDGYLCPPVPGRVDYIHHAGDLLADTAIDKSKREVPTGAKIRCLDIGTGANGIYPIVGHHEYGWSFTGTDIDQDSIQAFQQILESNPKLKEAVELRHQNDKNNVFKGIIGKDEQFDITLCNPPFHSSPEEAREGTIRKLRNLQGKKTNELILNFGGQSNELWCKGGEERFVDRMIDESVQFKHSCLWFTSLVSKHSNLKKVFKKLESMKVPQVKSIPMGTGNKTTRLVAWTFLNEKQRQLWIDSRWK